MSKVNTTEKRNISTMKIDLMDTEEILTVINTEEYKAVDAVREEMPVITRAVELIVPKLKEEGRLFYVGAGSSGRIGVLDAVECAPTFGVEPDKIIAIMAGGEQAMFLAQENMEDDYDQGAAKACEQEVNAGDCVIGIASSGNTPFVLGFIKKARSNGALTIGLCCNHDTLLEKEVDIIIKPVVGPEVITGSTRMKAATAQKMVLNMISTTIMIKMNKVYSNLMVDLKVSNQKLRERAVNIFTDITAAEANLAEDFLKKADYNVKRAIVMYVKKCSGSTADKLLKLNKGNLRNIIG